MATIRMEIDDGMAKSMGLPSIQKYLEKQLAILKLKYYTQKIGENLKDIDFDYNEALEQVRIEAWKEYKASGLSL